MKQHELAIKLRCSAPYLSLVENGPIDPPEAFKVKAAAILNLKVEELFPDEKTECDDRNEPCLNLISS